jgi:hypothetical protein
MTTFAVLIVICPEPLFPRVQSANSHMAYMPSFRDMGNAAVGHLHRHQGEKEKAGILEGFMTIPYLLLI